MVQSRISLNMHRGSCASFISCPKVPLYKIPHLHILMVEETRPSMLNATVSKLCGHSLSFHSLVCIVTILA